MGTRTHFYGLSNDMPNISLHLSIQHTDEYWGLDPQTGEITEKMVILYFKKRLCECSFFWGEKPLSLSLLSFSVHLITYFRKLMVPSWLDTPGTREPFFLYFRSEYSEKANGNIGKMAHEFPG